ncbi:MAG: CBS domain-containing protein [Sporichthyaceae bacterium]
MRISDVLRSKGTDVFTIAPETTVREFLAILAERRIGVCVISADGSTLAGICSERDVVRSLADQGAALLDEPVSTIATLQVHTAEPETSVEDIARLMTQRRIRHVPIVVNGALCGLISLGDVVKHRMDELETERQALVDYISSAG